jgi:dihydrodipicolinate synthase/N-acetylneuraminate lyase
MLTPTTDGSIDRLRTGRYAKRLIADGAHGLCVAGSAGQFLAMSVAERQELTDVVLAAVEDSAPVIVCAAAYRTEHAVELARHAEGAGAAAVMASAPYYVGAHEDAVWRHLSAIRRAVAIPVMLYHVPATTHVELPLEVLSDLVAADVIHAVKQSFYDAYHARDAKALLGDRAAVFCGHDGSALECLLMGADGWISALPALYPSMARSLWDGVQAGEPVAELRAKWFRLLPLVRLIFDPAERDQHGSPHWLEVMHAAANLLGHDVGPPRAPFGEPTDTDLERLARVLSEIESDATSGPAVRSPSTRARR